MESYRGQVTRIMLSRDDWKTRTRKQRTLMRKYSFVDRIIKLWNQLPAEALATFPHR